MKQVKKHLSGRKWPVFFFMCAVSLTVLIGGLVLYRNSIADAVDSTTISFMEQLAEHDIRNVGSQVQSRMNYIKSLGKRLELMREEEQIDISYLLSVDVQATQFEKLYLITAGGAVYDSSYLTTSLDEVLWADIYQNTTKDSVTRFAVDKREAWGEYLLYCTRIETPVYYRGELVEGIVGQVPMEELVGLTSLESFEGKGTTLIIQPSGEIITASRYYDHDNSLNYFTELEQADFIGGSSLEQCRTAITYGESFYMEYRFQDKAYNAMLKPMGSESYNNGWYIVVKVPVEVTAEQTEVVLKRSLFFFVILSIVLITLAVFILQTMRSEQAARASEQAKTTFLANMSHEIRTPLNGITGLIYLMRHNLDNPQKQEEYLEKAEVSAEFLKGIISDVLDMSKIESGQLELDTQNINLEKLLRDIEMLIGPQTEQRGQHFNIERSQLMVPWVIGDEVRLKQIIVNLLGNALKFTPAGGEIKLSVMQQVREMTTETVFVIRDTGCGMSQEFLEKIWQPFEQERRPGSQNGTGLGTTLSKILAEKMGGSIGVESEVGKGTAFTVRIPLPAAQQQKDELISAQTDRRAGVAGKHILAVEDNDINREILLDILEQYGMYVTPAVNGHEAVELFKQSEPFYYDVILMDLQMPVMNGYEAASTIRSLKRPDSTVAIFALTANAFKEEADQARESGMDGVVTKPIDVSVLLERISEV